MVFFKYSLFLVLFSCSLVFPMKQGILINNKKCYELKEIVVPGKQQKITDVFPKEIWKEIIAFLPRYDKAKFYFFAPLLGPQEKDRQLIVRRITEHLMERCINAEELLSKKIYSYCKDKNSREMVQKEFEKLMIPYKRIKGIVNNLPIRTYLNLCENRRMHAINALYDEFIFTDVLKTQNFIVTKQPQIDKKIMKLSDIQLKQLMLDTKIKKSLTSSIKKPTTLPVPTEVALSLAAFFFIATCLWLIVDTILDQNTGSRDIGVGLGSFFCVWNSIVSLVSICCCNHKEPNVLDYFEVHTSSITNEFNKRLMYKELKLHLINIKTLIDKIESKQRKKEIDFELRKIYIEFKNAPTNTQREKVLETLKQYNNELENDYNETTENDSPHDVVLSIDCDLQDGKREITE